MMIRRNILTAILATALAALLLPMAALADSHGAEPGQYLEGAWTVTVTPAGDEVPPPFVEIAAFMPGGVMVNVTSEGAAAVGEWVRTGDREFAVTFATLTIQDGMPISLTVRATITLDESLEGFSGPFQTDFAAGDGTVLFSVPGTVEGVRRGVQPLE